MSQPKIRRSNGCNPPHRATNGGQILYESCIEGLTGSSELERYKPIHRVSPIRSSAAYILKVYVELPGFPVDKPQVARGRCRLFQRWRIVIDQVFGECRMP